MDKNQEPAAGSNKLSEVVNTSSDKWAERQIFLIQAPTDNRKFLKFNKDKNTDSGDVAKGEWVTLPSDGTEESNDTILQKFCCVCNNKGGFHLLPDSENGKAGDTSWPYILIEGDKPVYYYKDAPDYVGSNQNDKVDIEGSDGMIKFQSGDDYLMRDGKITDVFSEALKCRFLPVRNMTTGNFTIGGEQGDGTNAILDFINATKKINEKDAIGFDFEQDDGPCPYNMITTEIQGDENCSKYFKQDSRYTMSNGDVANLAPGADVVLP